MKKQIITLASIFTFVFGCFAQSPVTRPLSIREADALYNKRQVPQAFRLYQDIYQNSSASKDDKKKSLQRLIYMSWRFYMDLGKARQYSKEFISNFSGASGSLVRLANYESEAGDYASAVKTAGNAIDSAAKGKDRLAAASCYARIVFCKTKAEINNHQEPDTNSLHKALVYVRQILEIVPESYTDAYTMLGLALLSRNGEECYKAYENYFYVPGIPVMNGKIGKIREKLKPLLLNWKGEKLNDQQRNTLILALAESQLFELADMMADCYPVSHETNDIIRIRSYTRFIQEFQKTTYDYYRDILFKGESKEKFVSKMDSLGKSLMSVTAPEMKFTHDNFRKLLNQKFSTQIVFNTKLNFYYGGLIIYDTTETGIQNGKKLTYSYKLVDFTFANAFQGWYNDVFLFGAFAGPNHEIFQYRVHMNEKTSAYWELVADKGHLDAWKKQIRTVEAKDEINAAKQPIADFESIREKFKYKALTRIMDSLSTQNLNKTELRKAFFNLVNYHNYCSEIKGHELCHQIEGGKPFSFLKSREKMEYKAMVASFRYSSDPYLAMINFKYPGASNNGFLSSYAKASRKVTEEIYAWMMKHQREIHELNMEKPILIQLDKLNGNQLYSAFSEIKQ